MTSPRKKASDFSVLASTLENAAFESSPHLRKTETQQDSNSTLLVVDAYPNCTLTEEEIARHGNGVCNPELAFDFDDMEWHQTINSEECGFDGGDCIDFNEKNSWYQDCYIASRHKDPWKFFLVSEIGDGACNGSNRTYNIEECGYDGGDCIEYNDKYPDCKSTEPWKIGDGICNTDGSEACGWDGGDCGSPPSTSAIVLMSVGLVAVIAFVAGGCCWWKKRRAKN